MNRRSPQKRVNFKSALTVVDEKLRDQRLPKRRIAKIRALAGPYARMVIEASKQAHVPSRLVAAVVQVENGGDFIGSAHRVSSAGAIGGDAIRAGYGMGRVACKSLGYAREH